MGYTPGGMNDNARLERLFARRTFGIKPGLDSIRALLRELDDPQESFRVLHVAGTDGKGSVCAMLDSVLRAAGLRTGLYTSPHLVRLSERFRIGGAEIADDAFFPLLDEVEAAAARLVARGAPEPTFFETTTALCALWWAREGVKLAVAEVGMGGRLDATNVFRPAVSVVTRIGLDHMQYLGDTVGAIAREKAGIAKPGVPLVLGAMPDEARAAIAARARETGAPVVFAPETVDVARRRGDLRGQTLAVSSAAADYGRVDLRLAASYQVENVATAVAALEALGRVLGIEWPAKTVAAGLAAATLPGRFQLLSDEPPTILDGGHNPCAAEALAAALKAAKAGRGVRLVCGMCADKDPAGWLRALAPVVGNVRTVPLSNERGLPPEKLAAFARGAGLREARACASLAEGLAAARADAKEAGRPVLVCGSLFLAGDVLASACG